MSAWRNDDSPGLNVHREHASYRLELWYRGNTPDHVTIVNGTDFEELTIHVDDIYALAEALSWIAAEADQ